MEKKDIQFQKITLENFKCHEYKEFEFLPNKLRIITGNNGTGKSSIFSALVWALYGTTLEGQTGDDIIRKRSGKNCSVKVEFFDNDNNHYHIEAYRKHKDYKNLKFVFCNGKDITPGSIKETHELIESLLLPKDVFLNCLVFSGFKTNFVDMTPAEKSEVLYKILNLGIYDKYRENINIMKKDFDQNVNSISLKINEIKGKIENIKQTIESLHYERERTLSDIDNQISLCNQKISDLNNKLSQIKIDENEYKKKSSCCKFV